jgi:hypothetical protein
MTAAATWPVFQSRLVRRSEVAERIRTNEFTGYQKARSLWT